MSVSTVYIYIYILIIYNIYIDRHIYIYLLYRQTYYHMCLFIFMIYNTYIYTVDGYGSGGMYRCIISIFILLLFL